MKYFWGLSFQIGGAEIRGWKEVLFVGAWRWHMEFVGELQCCVWSEAKVLVGSQVWLAAAHE